MGVDSFSDKKRVVDNQVTSRIVNRYKLLLDDIRSIKRYNRTIYCVTR